MVHCVSERQAGQGPAALGDRGDEVRLRLYPDNAEIVCCQDDGDDGRRGSLPSTGKDVQKKDR
ncbi:hypothetical protein AQJ27_40835 [Streptomyces olivochromogenes]|nr:hypothetical protein AQJ27_40835 [Streptomyces olivochromogenes]